jgi:hypothetical protein
MSRRLGALAVAGALGLAACASDGPAVSGIVVAVDGDLTGVRSFDLQTIGGERLVFIPGSELSAFDHAPLTHLGDHLRSGAPIEVVYATASDGTLVALVVRDA